MSVVILTWNNDLDIRLVSEDEKVKVFSTFDRAWAYADINDHNIEKKMRIVDLEN